MLSDLVTVRSWTWIGEIIEEGGEEIIEEEEGEGQYSIGSIFFKDLLRYPLARDGVYAPVGPVFLAHTKQKVSNIVGLTALRLAFFTGYE